MTRTKLGLFGCRELALIRWNEHTPANSLLAKFTTSDHSLECSFVILSIIDYECIYTAEIIVILILIYLFI